MPKRQREEEKQGAMGAPAVKNALTLSLSLEDLPTEIMSHIFSYVTPAIVDVRSFIRMASTCGIFRRRFIPPPECNEWPRVACEFLGISRDVYHYVVSRSYYGPNNKGIHKIFFFFTGLIRAERSLTYLEEATQLARDRPCRASFVGLRTVADEEIYSVRTIFYNGMSRFAGRAFRVYLAAADALAEIEANNGLAEETESRIADDFWGKRYGEPYANTQLLTRAESVRCTPGCPLAFLLPAGSEDYQFMWAAFYTIKRAFNQRLHTNAIVEQLVRFYRNGERSQGLIDHVDECELAIFYFTNKFFYDRLFDGIIAAFPEYRQRLTAEKIMMAFMVRCARWVLRGDRKYAMTETPRRVADSLLSGRWCERAYTKAEVIEALVSWRDVTALPLWDENFEYKANRKRPNYQNESEIERRLEDMSVLIQKTCDDISAM